MVTKVRRVEIGNTIDRSVLEADLKKVADSQQSIRDRTVAQKAADKADLASFTGSVKVRSQRRAQQKRRISILTARLREQNTLARLLRSQLSKVAVAVATGRAVQDVRRGEVTSLARERAVAAARKRVEAARIVPAIPDIIDLNRLARRTGTAGELFAEVRARPEATFTLSRRTLGVSVEEPGKASLVPASFEDPAVLEARAARVPSGVISPVDPRSRFAATFAADVGEIVEQKFSDTLRDPSRLSRLSSVRTVESGISSLFDVVGTRLERTALAGRVGDTLLEQSIIERRGGFSPEGLQAQASAFRTGLSSSIRRVIGEPVERGLFAATTFGPARAGVQAVAPIVGRAVVGARSRVGTLVSSVRELLPKVSIEVLEKPVTPSRVEFVSGPRVEPFLDLTLGVKSRPITPFSVTSTPRPPGLVVTSTPSKPGIVFSTTPRARGEPVFDLTLGVKERFREPLILSIQKPSKAAILEGKRAVKDVLTAGFTAGFVGTRKDTGTFGGALGEAVPFVAPSVVSPVAGGIGFFSRVVGRQVVDVGRALPVLLGSRAGKRGTFGRKPKSLVQRSKEARGQVPRDVFSREARLRKRAVAQLRTELTPPQKIFELQTRGGTLVTREITARATRRFRRSQTRAGVGRGVSLGPEESLIISRSSGPIPGLSKRAARRARQAAKRDVAGSSQALVFAQTQQIPQLVKPKITVIPKRVARPKVEGELRPRTSGFDELGSVLAPSRKGRLLSVVEEPSEIPRGFRPGQKDILTERLRVSRETLRGERAFASELSFERLSIRSPALPVISGLASEGIILTKQAARSSLKSASDLSLSPVSASDLSLTPTRVQAVRPITSLSPASALVSAQSFTSSFISDFARVQRSDLRDVLRPVNQVFPESVTLPVRPVGPLTPRVPRGPRRPRLPVRRRPLPLVPRPVRSPLRPSILKRPVPIPFLLPEREVAGVPGFRVLVRTRGEFRLASDRALTRAAALQLGAKIADTTAAQTFKLLETDEFVKPGDDDPSKFTLAGLLSKFNQKSTNVFQEKRGKNLIDTAGELAGITFKGIEARRRGRLF